MTKESRLYNGGKTVSSVNGSEKTGQLHVKTKVENSLPPYTKVNSKWIKYLHVREDTIKLLEENSRTLSDINYSSIFSNPCPRVMEIKIKINKYDLIKLKNVSQQGKP